MHNEIGLPCPRCVQRLRPKLTLPFSAKADDFTPFLSPVVCTWYFNTPVPTVGLRGSVAWL